MDSKDYTQEISWKVLDKYFSSDKHSPINMGETLIRYMTDDSVNKIEAQRWNGLDGNLRNTQLRDLLYRSDFWTERQQAAQWFATHGEIAIALINIDSMWYVSFFKPLKYTEFKRVIEEITVEGIGTLKTKNGQSQLYYRWRKAKDNEINPKTNENISGRIIRETFWYNNEYLGDKKTEKIQETYIYDSNVKEIPVKLIRNNANSNPDWLKAGTILQEMNLLSNDIGIEWENIKTQWNSVGVMGKGKQAQKRQKEINNGQRMYSDASANSKYAQQFGVIMSGSSTVATLIQTIAYLEDRSLKYSFQGRDTDSSGANKHNAEISLWNQSHSEYLVRKKQQREKDYYRFFKDVVEPITGIVCPTRIRIDSSAYEQGKEDAIRYMESQRQLLAAQSASQRAQAEKHKAAAEKDIAEIKEKERNEVETVE